MAKSDSVEYEKRIRIVQEWLIDDWATVDIKAEIKRRWELSDVQARKYIYKARDRWEEREDEKLEKKRRRKVESLKKLKRTLKPEYVGTPKGINATLNVDKEINKLEDLYPALKMENDVRVLRPLFSDEDELLK